MSQSHISTRYQSKQRSWDESPTNLIERIPMRLTHEQRIMPQPTRKGGVENIKTTKMCYLYQRKLSTNGNTKLIPKSME